MRLSSLLQLRLKLGLGFTLLLLCLAGTIGANLVASVRYQGITDTLIDHLYPARNETQNILRLVQSMDNNGAKYILSSNPTQQQQLLQAFQQGAQDIQKAIDHAMALADTPEQRTALSDFTAYFFGDGGYYQNNLQIFELKQAGQELTAEDNFARSPFFPVIQQEMQIYSDVVNREIAQELANENMVSGFVQILNFGFGGCALLFCIITALYIYRSIGLLYFQINEKNSELTETNAHLQALSTTDPLTELPNHRALLADLKQELERAQRYDRTCSLLFLDIDHFKALNDGYGHAAGDTVLTEFARVVSHSLRSMDTIGRWGGEEFVVILPEATTQEALDIAERVRKAVSFHSFQIGGGLHLTCSIGVASYPEHANLPDTLINAADQAMYGAKHLGRNQVRQLGDPAVTTLLIGELTEGGREEAGLRGTAEALVALVEERDVSLGDHSQSVSQLVKQLALSLNLSQEEAKIVGLAGLLHDIGKIAISDAILQKPGPLTKEEWEQMRRHSVVGAEVINHIPSLRPLVPVIRAHHERWDGSGYPDHLKGEQIPLAARMIAVVDAYSVMMTDRPYQQAFTTEEAFRELVRCAGTQFDPSVVEALITLLQTKTNQPQREVAGVA